MENTWLEFIHLEKIGVFKPKYCYLKLLKTVIWYLYTVQVSPSACISQWWSCGPVNTWTLAQAFDVISKTQHLTVLDIFLVKVDKRRWSWHCVLTAEQRLLIKWSLIFMLVQLSGLFSFEGVCCITKANMLSVKYFSMLHFCFERNYISGALHLKSPQKKRQVLLYVVCRDHLDVWKSFFWFLKLQKKWHCLKL